MSPNYRFLDKNEKHAHSLRAKMTPPEERLWSILSKRTNPSFKAQVPVLNWILDFYSPEINLAIEVDGNWHRSRRVQEKDRIRDLRLWEEAGVYTLRVGVWNVFKDLDGVVSRIDTVIDNLNTLDHTSPLLRYRSKTSRIITYSPEEKQKLIKELEARGKGAPQRYSPC